MAKIPLRSYKYIGSPARRVHVVVEIRKTILDRNDPRGVFQACAFLKQESSKAYSCDHGKNPRVAISNALTRVAKGIRKRSGAFAGLGGSRKRRR